MLGIPYKFLRQNEVTVGGYTGLKIEYTMDNYDFDIFTIANGKLYQLSYDEEPLKVPETLRLANKMVESFQVNTEDEDEDNNLSYEEYVNKFCPENSLVLCAPPPESEE
jgi:nucleoside-triphosphatase THEP1